MLIAVSDAGFTEAPRRELACRAPLMRAVTTADSGQNEEVGVCFGAPHPFALLKYSPQGTSCKFDIENDDY